jgi:hypothetical protein
MVFNLMLFFIGTLTSVFATDLKLLDSQAYLINLPQEIIYEYLTNNEDLYFATSNKPSFKLEKNEFYVKILNNPILPCTNDSLGTEVSTPIQTNGDNAMWSFMKIYHAYDSFLDTYCPIIAECETGSIFNGDCVTQNATYSFCAEKEGKRIAICIQQQTKNEEQAKKIFESFRWLDEVQTSSVQSTEFSSSTITVSSVSSESSQSSLSSSSSSAVAIEPIPVTPQPWYVRFWQWLLSWF